jgi:methylated-DNA-[protein]-cysteine S-methyltransferase
MTITVTDYRSPLGEVRLAVRDGRLCAMAFREGWPRLERTLARRFPGSAPAAGDAGEIRRRLDAYFGGELTALDAIAVDPGGTAFQQAVWTALRRIPVGSTTTYGALARAIGTPSAVRAVGAANGANPIWLVVPCHRAIGADGRLVGYAGGLERKRWLLTHERAVMI